MKEKRKYWIILLIGLTTLAIWVNSAVPKTQSAQMSGGLTAWLESTFQLRLTEHLIRKMGHLARWDIRSRTLIAGRGCRWKPARLFRHRSFVLKWERQENREN